MIKHPCFVCRGACCESITINFGKLDSDRVEYLETRTTGEDFSTGRVYTIRCVCPKLRNGLCSIHTTKPKICKEYPIGSEACLNAVRRNRSKKKQIEISETIEIWRRVSNAGT